MLEIHSQKTESPSRRTAFEEKRQGFMQIVTFWIFRQIITSTDPIFQLFVNHFNDFPSKTLKLESFSLKSSKKLTIDANQRMGECGISLPSNAQLWDEKKQRGTVLFTNYARKMRQGDGIIEFSCSHDTKRQKILHNPRQKLANRTWFVRNRRISDEKNLRVMRLRPVSIGEVQESALLATLGASKHLNDSEKLRILQGSPLTAISFFKSFPSSIYWKRRRVTWSKNSSLGTFLKGKGNLEGILKRWLSDYMERSTEKEKRISRVDRNSYAMRCGPN